MDWTPGGMSSDVEDRRDDSGGGGGGFGFGGGSGLGIVGVLVLIVISLVTGHNFLGGIFGGGGGGVQGPPQQVQQGPARPHSAAEDRDAQLISYVLDDVQKDWTQIFQQEGKQYRHAKLVMFRDATYSGCGTAQAATGPFYCPQDEKVYIDLGFWDELRKFGGSTADAAQAYVIAHELGHHVQKLLGTEGKVTRLEQQEPGERNHLSVDLELQADCYAGVWAHSGQQSGKFHPEDVNAALRAASAVGDDHLQKMSGRAVSPEKFTHGSAAQRTSWFRRGLDSGDPAQCNTFGGATQ
jgi:predicted metalloprotease